jgi:dethiobiotin synthetase
VIADAYRRLAGRADAVVVEGAGGTCVPLDAQLDLLDVPRGLRLPVVLVVGVRLGCLNHALLSTLAVEARGVRLAGWIACRIDPAMPLANENVAWLARRLPMPLVADLASAEPAPVPAAALAALGLLERPS